MADRRFGDARPIRVLDTSIVNAALPHSSARGLSAGIERDHPVLTSYLIANGS
jgi:hypothetical protein